MYRETRFETSQIDAFDYILRQIAESAGIQDECIALVDDDGHPAWRVGQRTVRAVRPTSTQATLYVTDGTREVCTPWPGLTQMPEWVSHRIFVALFELPTTGLSVGGVVIRDRGAYLEFLSNIRRDVRVRFSDGSVRVGVIEIDGDSVASGAYVRTNEGRWKIDLNEMVDARPA